VADGRMGREGHNKFTVRFKFAKRKLVQTGHSLSVSSSKHFLAPQGIFFKQFCYAAKLQQTGGGENGFYAL